MLPRHFASILNCYPTLYNWLGFQHTGRFAGSSQGVWALHMSENEVRPKKKEKKRKKMSWHFYASVGGKRGWVITTIFCTLVVVASVMTCAHFGVGISRGMGFGGGTNLESSSTLEWGLTTAVLTNWCDNEKLVMIDKFNQQRQKHQQSIYSFITRTVQYVTEINYRLWGLEWSYFLN